jgi:hypothetical protein
MVETFAYTIQQASRLTKDRRAWAALAIGTPTEPVAVLYLDAKVREFFGKKDSSRQKSIYSSCLGIAEFIKRRYK